VLGIVLIAALSGGRTPSVNQLSAHRSRTAARAGHARKTRSAASPTSASSTTSTAAASTPSTSASTPQSADQLEAQGHQLLAQGAYTQAIPTLRRAVTAASPGSVQQGYALYDLGQALFLSGDPAAAVPILEQRMQIDDQLPTVRKLLDAALAASGQGQAGAGSSGGAGASAALVPLEGRGAPPAGSNGRLPNATAPATGTFTVTFGRASSAREFSIKMPTEIKPPITNAENASQAIRGGPERACPAAHAA